MEDNPSYKTSVPTYMLEGPHMIHLNGIFVHPGRDNDYTFGIENGKTIVFWWNPEIEYMVKTSEMVVSVLRLDTGERWGISNQDGIFIDTRKNKM